MKKWFVLGCIATILLGSAWHFFYNWWPHFLVGLFAPVNESVWEHLKLLFWPVIPAALILGQRFGKKKIWSAFLWAMLQMPMALIAIYYTASAGFGIYSLRFDIGLYVLIVCAGFWLAYRSARSGQTESRLGELLMLAGIYASALVLFSIAAPGLPIFQPLN